MEFRKDSITHLSRLTREYSTTPADLCSRLTLYPDPDPNSGHSHSMVPGGLEVRSYRNRLTPGTSFTTRFDIRSSTSNGIRAQSAVIKSSVVTARKTMKCAYVR